MLKEQIKKINKDDIFITQGDNLPVTFRKSKNGTYDKNIVTSVIRDLYSGEGEQSKFDTANKTERDKDISRVNNEIAKAQNAIKIAIRQKTPAAQIKAEKKLIRLQAQLKQIK